MADSRCEFDARLLALSDVHRPIELMCYRDLSARREAAHGRGALSRVRSGLSAMIVPSPSRYTPAQSPQPEMGRDLRVRFSFKHFPKIFALLEVATAPRQCR
jgi:hypothetical protein